MAPSDGKLAGSVLELSQTLTRYNSDLKECTAEKERTSKILSEFKKHTAWQGQRKQLMRRNQERLFNESTWLETKTTEVGCACPKPAMPTAAPSLCTQVRQDLLLVSNELRQVKAELAKVRAARDAAKAEVSKLDMEVRPANTQHDPECAPPPADHLPLAGRR